MNRTSSFLSTVLMVVMVAIASLFTLPAMAQAPVAPPPVRYWAGLGTGTTSLSYYVATANGVGTAQLHFVDVTSDKTNSVLKFYTAGAPITVTTNSAISQAVISAPSDSVTTNDVIVVRSIANDTYQRMVVSTTSTNGTITATGNLSFGLVVGDRLYKMTAAGAFVVDAATKQVNGGGGEIYNGQEGRPLLFEVDGTSACKINLCSGVFAR